MKKLVDIKEVQALLRASGRERYEYSIKKIADNDEIWIIGDKAGLATYKDDMGKIIFPIWPTKEFAALCCIGLYKKYHSESIELDFFRSDYISDFIVSNQRLAVFPIPEDKGIIINAKQFEEDLSAELDKY